METIMEALPGKLQMISGDGKLLYPEANKFVEELKEISTASSQYTVISIIGPQSSGKSYFLNTLFSTKFDVLDASKGRHQTTKGIWIAKCVKPLMIIMDVEGCDGTERGEDDTLFERQSALFSLTISDVLLLNMWYTDIGRQNGGNFGLIKIIFEERVKIEAPKTTIIILVRDYDYETPVDITRKKLKEYMNKIWEKVHPTTTNTKMSDYIKVIVKDFPHKREEQDFAQKCKELSESLCNLAANGSLEQKTGASTFAYSSQLIWELILENKRLSIADHKLAMSTHVCSVIKDEILNSLDQETEYGSLTSGTSMSVNEFNRELNLFLKTILARYETGTKACDNNIRQNVMVKLQEETLQRFERTFEDRIESLSTEMLSSMKSVVHDKIDNLVELEQSFVVDLIWPYMAEFDDNSRADLNPYFRKVLKRHRKKLQEDFTRIAEEEAYKIQIERDEKKKIELQIELEQKNAKEIQMERDRLKEKEELKIKFEQQKQQELQIERDRFKAKELEMKHDKEREKELQTERDRLKEKELKMERDRLKEQEEFLIKREQIRERELQLQQETLIKLQQMEQMRMPPPCTIS